MSRRKPAILVVSYGCGYVGAREKALDQIEADIQEAYPDYLVCRAWTSKRIRQRILEQEGIWIPGVKEAMEELLERGIRDVIIQPLHVLDGSEHRSMIEELKSFEASFSQIVTGALLLSSEKDKKRIVRVIGGEIRPGVGKALVLAGHGAGSADAVYREMDDWFAAEGYGDIILGTMEGELGFAHVLARIRSRRPEGIVLAPFMITAGKHAVRDLCGEQKDSWKSRLEEAGFPVECILRGMGEYEGIRRIYVEHVEKAMRRYTEQSRHRSKIMEVGRDMKIRPRRLRYGETLRKMVRETRMDTSSLIYPIFVKEGKGILEEIPTMPGQYRYSVDTMERKLEELLKAGVCSVMFFGIPEHKDEVGSGAYAEDGIIQKALRQAKREFPELYLITDVCMCEYTSHGHCGVLCGQDVNNDETLKLLAKTALSHAQAGADMVAPSDMMDGRVAAIRDLLDENGYIHTPIMSYAVKYASAFYGPFRDAAGSAPAFGDRKSYQMDYHNSREGIKEALLDIEEGADIIMVKPAMTYLDMVTRIKETVNVPVAAYSVSGEYAMIKAGAKLGYIDEEKIICETAASAFRAGCDIYLTYYAEKIAKFIQEGKIG